MQPIMKNLFVIITASALCACGDAGIDKVSTDAQPVELSNDVPAVTFTPENDSVGKPRGPVTVAYRIIGKPVVGQPIAIDLQISSSLGNQPMRVDYRINDATAMRLADSQPESLTFAPAEDRGGSQQVTVIPLREGRLFFNVSVSVDTDNGSMSTVTAIPVQVGEAPRPLQENGTATTDENGDAIRTLPAQEN